MCRRQRRCGLLWNSPSVALSLRCKQILCWYLRWSLIRYAISSISSVWMHKSREGCPNAQLRRSLSASSAVSLIGWVDELMIDNVCGTNRTGVSACACDRASRCQGQRSIFTFIFVMWIKMNRKLAWECVDYWSECDQIGGNHLFTFFVRIQKETNQNRKGLWNFAKVERRRIENENARRNTTVKKKYINKVFYFENKIIIQFEW